VSETPERIEREMFEIRSRMSPDMTDLRKHMEPQVVAEQVKQTIRQRLRDAADRGKANLKAKQQDFAYSAKRQLSQVRRNISNDRGE
jgi:macrodomain Ter protein organizer (MatP/YcbG family)